MLSCFLYRKFRFLLNKNALRGLHCGRAELCHESDLLQAKNLASEILYVILLDNKEEIP